MKPFEDVSMFDELRRFTAGQMSVEERARFESELQRDPELARLAADFKAVWLATENGLRRLPTSRTEFETIARRVSGDTRSGTWRRRAAAAVVIFAVAAGAWFTWRAVHADTVVELRTIPWNETRPTPPDSPVVPAVLADWSPVENGKIRWLESVDEARAVSAAVGRPIFVYGYVEECPICQGYQRNEFQDPEILALVAKAVPVRINLMELEREEAEALYKRRYPLLEMQNERGEILRTFAGSMMEVDMQGELTRAVAGVAGPNWRLVHDLARLVMKANEAETAGKLAEAAGSFEKLADADGLPLFAEAGNAGLSRMATAAANLVESARAEALRDEPGAIDRFESACGTFEGTPFEADLRAVLHAWREDGRFPVLTVQK